MRGAFRVKKQRRPLRFARDGRGSASSPRRRRRRAGASDRRGRRAERGRRSRPRPERTPTAIRAEAEARSSATRPRRGATPPSSSAASRALGRQRADELGGPEGRPGGSCARSGRGGIAAPRRSRRCGPGGPAPPPRADRGRRPLAPRPLRAEAAPPDGARRKAPAPAARRRRARGRARDRSEHGAGRHPARGDRALPDENFELDDPDGLLDEVYARAGGWPGRPQPAGEAISTRLPSGSRT